MSDEEKLVSHYRLKTLLRRDGFGAVYFAEDTRDQKECVLRVIELDQATLARITGRVRVRSQRDHPLIEQIRQRMKRISELKNAHVLPVIEFGEEHIQGNNDIIFYMVSPYEKESLLSYWSEHTSSAELISLAIVTEFISQAAEALYYIHRRGLIHQYVRLSSFMLRSTTRSRKLHLYLTDFWFADISVALLEEGQIAQDLSVYLASEQLASGAVFASDQYALAILAYELLLGHRLSQVDLSLGLYERFARQRGVEVSEAELVLAHRLDIVLARALAEDASARYQNIEEFAFTFRSVARGEATLLEEDTAKLPVIGRRSSQRAEEIVAGAAGALVAGEIVEEITETSVEVDETTYARHPSLHKTVLTSAGMEATEVAASGEFAAETLLSEQETIVSETTRSETVVEEEETLTVIEGEETRSSASAGALGAAGFVAGLAVGEVLPREAGSSEEQALLAGSSAAAFAAGEEHQREIDVAEERAEVRESSAGAFAAGAAAGLVAGEERQREIDIAEERTEVRESSSAAFAAGAAAGAVAGLAAGEASAFEQETDIAEERTQIIPASGGAGGAAVYEQETDIAEERTQIIPAAGGVLLAGAAGLAAGELLAGGFSATEAAGGAGLAGGGIIAGSSGAAQATGGGAAGLAESGGGGAAGDYTGEKTQAGGGAASLAGGGVFAGGAAIGGEAGLAGMGGGAAGDYTGEKTQAGGVVGGAAGGAGLAGAGAGGFVAGGSAVGEAAGLVGAGGVAAGGAAGVGGFAAGGSAVGGAANLAGGGGVAAGGYTGERTQATGGGVAGGGVVPPYARRRRRRGRTLLAAIIIALLLVLIGGTIAVHALNQSSATVTLTLESHTIQNTYLVTATTATTTTSGQVQASFLTQSATQSESGQASGYYAGAHSSGFIKFYNSSTGCGCPIIIPAGTAFTGASGVTVVTDEVASVSSLCYVTVHAHAVIYGPGGNIPANDVQTSYSSKITAKNPYGFSGGQAAQSNALVQQSDIDHLAKALQAQVVQSAQADLQAQVQSNQHLFAQPVCRIKVKSDHNAGDFASNLAVTVTAICTAEAYDYSAAIQIVQQQVQTEASSYSSDQYVLANGLQTTVTSATVTDAKTGTVLLAIKVVGKWIRKLGKNLEQSLPQFLAGKSVSTARSLLSQIGAASVDISVSGHDQSTLPADSSKIKIVVKS